MTIRLNYSLFSYIVHFFKFELPSWKFADLIFFNFSMPKFGDWPIPFSFSKISRPISSTQIEFDRMTSENVGYSIRKLRVQGTLVKTWSPPFLRQCRYQILAEWYQISLKISSLYNCCRYFLMKWKPKNIICSKYHTWTKESWSGRIGHKLWNNWTQVKRTVKLNYW